MWDQGSMESLSGDNIRIFMQAIEDNHDQSIMKPKQDIDPIMDLITNA